jgi:hypothetical protein
MIDQTMRTGFALVLLAVLTACGAAGSSQRSGSHAPEAEPENETDLKALYRMALEDAAIADPDEVHDLKRPEGEPVTVLSWVKNEFLQYYPAGETIFFTRFTWVTLPPEVQDKCRQFQGEHRIIRMQQLLGLPPDHHEERSFVVMEVHRKDLFRPCIDPNIDTLQCAVQAEVTDGAHGIFFANQTVAAYGTPPGYPWTRLGYTFDWNPATPEYGVSEYVIVKNVAVTIKEIIPTEKYCAP